VVYGGREANVLITAANFELNTEFSFPKTILGISALNNLRNNIVGLNHLKFHGNCLSLNF